MQNADEHATLFFFNDTATTEIYTLSLHDALPISLRFGQHLLDCRYRISSRLFLSAPNNDLGTLGFDLNVLAIGHTRSEEHTSELQSRQYLVCRLLLEKTQRLRSIIKSSLLCRQLQ